MKHVQILRKSTTCL